MKENPGHLVLHSRDLRPGRDIAEMDSSIRQATDAAIRGFIIRSALYWINADVSLDK